jgi:hypothetical protein
VKKRKLQVFVSSTFTDLKEERQAAVSAILKAGHIPAGMELFTAGDQSQMAIIKRWIDDSDVYMLILGGRYGSVEETTGISYTELEYDYAVEQGKSVFAVVVQDDALEGRVREKGTDYIEKESPRQLAQFREKVLKNISSFYSDPKDIRLCVYESLSDFENNRQLKGWVPADEVEDSSALLEEIRNLKEDNEQLKVRLEAALSKPERPTVKGDEELKELSEVIRNIEVNLPKDLRGKEAPASVDLLELFSASRDQLITGVTNAMNASDLNSFLYHNVGPKLQLYDLASNEKVAGVRYRRTFLTKKGRDLLRYADKHKLVSGRITVRPPNEEDDEDASPSKESGGDSETKAEE